ncbi:MAG: hemolysin family protein [Chitinophagaceae bacterium]
MYINLSTVIGIVLSIILIGFFAGIQIAFVNVNRLTIELKKKQGKSSSILLSRLISAPTKFLGTTLIGFNICLVVYGLLVGEMLFPLWNWLIIRAELPATYVNLVKLIFETLVSTAIILIVGEFIPRAIWRSKSELLLNPLISKIVNFFYQLFHPVATFFVALSAWILRYLFNVRVDETKDAFTRSDLEHFFHQNHEPGEESSKDLNTELFENALSLPNIKIRQCLIPRKEITGIELSSDIETARKKFVHTQLSKLLVYEGNIDHIVGYIHQLDLFKQPATVESILLSIPAVPESMSATDLINKFSKERKSIAWVVDEFGGTAGIVTMEDLLEEIFGEIRDEYDTEEFEEKKIAEDEFLFSGRLELDYLNEKYNFELPADEAETLSGLIISEHEKIPRVKERIIVGDYEFDIMGVSDTRIEMVRMKVLK